MTKPRAEARKALVEAYTTKGKRKNLVRIPKHELAEFNADYLPEGIRLLSNGQYQARYRGPNKAEFTKTFDVLTDAKDWRRKGLAQVSEGTWDDPRRGRETVNHFYGIYRTKQQARLKASSFEDGADIWDRQVSLWGDYQVAAITYADVEDWARGLAAGGYSQSYVRRCALALKAILEEAVARGAIRANPINMKRLSKVFPKPSPHEANPLTLQQLDLLIEHSSEHYRALTEFIARTGLRISEAREVRVFDLRISGVSPSGVDYSKKPELFIARAAVRVPKRDSDGNLIKDENGVTIYEEVVDTPKSGRRRIPLAPRALQIAKAAAAGKKADDLLFINIRGGRVSKHGFGTSLADAAARAQIETETKQNITPHSLRDTFATQAILSGASIIAVSKALGHAKPTMTLDRYAGLLPEDTETLRAGLTNAEKEHSKRRKK